MHNSVKLFLLSTAILVTAVIVSATAMLVRYGMQGSIIAINNLWDVFNSVSEPEFAEYDSEYIEGKKVREIIEMYGGEYFFRVRTTKNTVSFGVYDKPVNHTISNGMDEYYDYTDVDSLYYIDENAQFLVTKLSTNGTVDMLAGNDKEGAQEEYKGEATKDGKTVVGAYFSQRDSGSMSEQMRQKYRKPDGSSPTTLEAKTAYLESLIAGIESINPEDNRVRIEDFLKALKQIANDVDGAKEDWIHAAEDSVGSAISEAYNTASAENMEAVEKLAEAWDKYVAMYKLANDIPEKQTVTHYPITTVRGEDDISALAYWDQVFGETFGEFLLDHSSMESEESEDTEEVVEDE